MKLELAIDRIVVEGAALSPADTRRLRRALMGELSRLLSGVRAEDLVAANGGMLTSLNAPPLTAAGDGREFGRELARSIHRALAPQLTSDSADTADTADNGKRGSR